jgi:centrosomal protein CEP104
MEAVKEAELEDHRARNSCVVAKPANMYNRCPLCHMDIPPGDEGWRKHLLEGRGCPANTRPVMKM